MVLIKNPYLEEVNRRVYKERSDIVGISSNKDISEDRSPYDTEEELRDAVDNTADEINTTLKNVDDTVDENTYKSLILLFRLGCVYGKYKQKDLQCDNSDPCGMLYDTAYMTAYDEAEKLLWIIQNE